ncbi:hypothetical protein U1Q18_012520 [Sarracenia purpurea var. burkii]
MFTGASNVEPYGSGKEIVSVKLPSVSSIEGSQDNDSEKSIVRNQPIQPPKKPEKAPFFLPSVPSLSGEIMFKPVEEAKDGKDKKADEIEKNRKQADLAASSQFVQLLQISADMNNCKFTCKDINVFFTVKFRSSVKCSLICKTLSGFAVSAFTDHIKSLSSSTLDMELRMLQIIDDDDEQEPDKRPEFHCIQLLLDYFIHEISCRNNFEFIQAVVRLFLKIHGETIRQQPKLQGKVQKLLEIQCRVWQRVDKLFQSARCLVTFLSNSQF